MAILASFCIGSVGPNYVTVNGASFDNSVQFQAGSGFNVNVDFNSLRINEDIEDAVKAKLQTSPYNMTFGSGDTVRLLPASG